MEEEGEEEISFWDPADPLNEDLKKKIIFFILSKNEPNNFDMHFDILHILGLTLPKNQRGKT